MCIMDLETFNRLLAPEGQALLAEASSLAPSPVSYLRCYQKLKKNHPAPLVHAALETVMLRQKARPIFSRADGMYFTREALEQSSAEVISCYRARRFADFQTVGDFGCGIGGDTIGLAALVPVLAIDRDPLRLHMAKENLASYKRHENVSFREADLQALPMPDVDAVFFDPARRKDGKRHLSVADYVPPLHIIQTWLEHIPAIGVKIAPGVDLRELADFDAEVEFISVSGELKECVLWFGPLKTCSYRAMLLPREHTLYAEGPVVSVPLSNPQRYFYEPDPAILRAGLVALLAEQIGACQIDPSIAYLTSDTLTHSPFANAYLLEDAFPFHLKKLRQWLRQRQVGTITVKKRGSAVDVIAFVKKLKLTGEESRIVFLTRVLNKPYILIGSEMNRST